MTTTASARTILPLNKQQQQHIEELDQLEVENYYKAHCYEMNQKVNGLIFNIKSDFCS